MEALNAGLLQSSFLSAPSSTSICSIKPVFVKAPLYCRTPALQISAAADGVDVSIEERILPASSAAVSNGSNATTSSLKTTNGKSAGNASLTTEEIIALESELFVHTYARAPVVFVRGEGSKLYDIEGKEYIDMAGGIAVNALGHADPEWVQAVTQQAGALAHVSNLYHTVPQVLLAQRLIQNSFADRIFFANSGTEANEAAIKFSRKYQRVVAANEGVDSPAVEFVSFSNCFHGRTMGSLALTYKEQYRTPFEPVMQGANFATYGDLESAAAVIKKGVTAAVFVEPVQGEGGVFPATQAFLDGLRKLCDEAGALLVFDEVQCGLGRTGKLFAHEVYGVNPDIMTLAKPLAGGLPIGAVLVTQAVADAIKPGDHGSTFAGGPLVCHAALATLDRIQSPGFLEDVISKGEYLCEGLRKAFSGNPHVKEVRGSGLLVGVQLDVSAGPWVDAAREKGVLAITAGKGDVLRLAPPLVITREEIDLVIQRLAESLSL